MRDPRRGLGKAAPAHAPAAASSAPMSWAAWSVGAVTVLRVVANYGQR